jgi:hypothetical protein
MTNLFILLATYFNPETITIIAGFIITALGIIFNPAITSKIKDLKEEITKKIDQFVADNNSVHNTIISDVNNIKRTIDNFKKSLSEHTEFIIALNKEKEVKTALEYSIKEATMYIDTKQHIHEYLMCVFRKFVKVVDEIMTVGIEKIDRIQLENKMKLFRANCFSHNEVDFIDEDFLREFSKYRKNKPDYNRYIDEIMTIKDDKVNSKISRFRVITENYFQNLLRDAVLVWSEFIIRHKEVLDDHNGQNTKYLQKE